MLYYSVSTLSNTYILHIIYVIIYMCVCAYLVDNWYLERKQSKIATVHVLSTLKPPLCWIRKKVIGFHQSSAPKASNVLHQMLFTSPVPTCLYTPPPPIHLGGVIANVWTPGGTGVSGVIGSIIGFWLKDWCGVCTWPPSILYIVRTGMEKVCIPGGRVSVRPATFF